jgi:uncharacterized delta-60 repeat protein
MYKQTFIILAMLTSVLLFGQTPEWTYRINGTGNDYDEAVTVVYGSDGYVYTAGYSWEVGSGYDLTVISLTTTGSPRWQYHYNGPGNDADGAYSIIYGLDGNIYVAGSSMGDSTDNDFTIISLTTAGTERWVYRYNGTGNGADVALNIKYGFDGNVYATGYSKAIDSTNDFIVISLTPLGNERWVYRYSGTGSGDDAAYCLSCASDSNIYAAGTTYNNNLDFTVISLNTAGTQRWIYNYNGTGNSIDEAYSIVCGQDGNMYASGYSYSTSTDFMVISLSSTGTERWTYRYNGPGSNSDCSYSIIYGNDGNIYSAGFSTGINSYYDFTVLSLTSSGSSRWTYRYIGSGGYYDGAYQLVYGNDNYIYAAGYIYTTTSYYDFAVVKLSNSSGNSQWVYQYNGSSNGYDGAYYIAYGLDNNLYAVGYSWGASTYYDYTVTSINQSSNERWTYRYNGLGTGYDVANSVVAGPNNNIYACGSTWGNGTFSDFIINCLNTAGTQQWRYNHNGSISYDDVANDIVCGLDGNIYACGYSSENGTYPDFTIISLSAAGDERWVYNYNGTVNGEDKAISISCGQDGNIYACGYSYGTDSTSDIIVVSLSTLGTERWVYRYNGPASNADRAYKVIYGSDGNIYVAGYSTGSNSATDFTVISITNTGSPRWVYRYNGVGNNDDIAYDIAYGLDGNIYAGGLVYNNAATSDMIIISLTNAGNQRWLYQYNGPGYISDGITCLLNSSDSNLYAAGYTAGEGTYTDFTVLSITYQGNERWVYRYNGPGN